MGGGLRGLMGLMGLVGGRGERVMVEGGGLGLVFGGSLRRVRGGFLGGWGGAWGGNPKGGFLGPTNQRQQPKLIHKFLYLDKNVINVIFPNSAILPS